MQNILHLLRPVSIILFIIFLSSPAALLAQEQQENQELRKKQTKAAIDTIQGITEGQEAAKGSPLWFFSGLALNYPGVLLAEAMPPDPPLKAFIGQSSSYRKGYVIGYQEVSSEKNKRYAAYGCVINGVVVAGYLILMFSLMTTSID
jgi:hypothetical protein